MRSLLFVPGHDERKLAKALESGADALILDLEDAVPDAEKPRARGVTEALKDLVGKKLVDDFDPVDGFLSQGTF